MRMSGFSSKTIMVAQHPGAEICWDVNQKH